MPIYEFYCVNCHTVFSFRSGRVDTAAQPSCPRCQRPQLERRVSSFAISKGQKEPAGGADPLAGVDESRLEKAFESLAGEMEGIDESDPRQAARMMRKLFEATGLERGPGMEEAIRRLEAGEDPESIEADLGDALEDEGELLGQPKASLANLRRKALPPRVDDKLYEL